MSAIGYLPAAGAESCGLGGAGLLLGNAFCAANHQAMMPWQKKPEIGFSCINRFGLKDINQVYLTAVVPHKGFGYGFKLYNFGNATYKENCIGLSVAHAFHPNFSLGLGANYHGMNIMGYGHTNAITIVLSVAAKINEKISLAFMAVNPNRTKLNDYQDERLPTIYQFGLGYKINKQVNALVQIEKNNAFKPDCKVGLEYAPKESLKLRMGFSTLQPQFAFGLGFIHKKCKIDWASSIHQSLGISNTISFAFEIGR